MSIEHHDDNCDGCRPVLIDTTTGKPQPDEAPEMVALLRVWSETTIEERRAFHRVTVNNSRAAEDLKVIQRLQWRIEDAFKKDGISRAPQGSRTV